MVKQVVNYVTIKTIDKHDKNPMLRDMVNIRGKFFIQMLSVQIRVPCRTFRPYPNRYPVVVSRSRGSVTAFMMRMAPNCSI